MLAVKKEYRGKGIATKLVRMAIDRMIERDADEVHALLLSPSHRLEAWLTRFSSLDCTRD